jgi:hypothetical protein
MQVIQSESNTTALTKDRFRGIAIGLVLCLCLVAAALAPSAHAAKGWSFLETFGSANKPAFGDDRRMAVDRSSGDFLIIDNSNRTLSRWHADGTPSNFSVLGSNAIDGAGGADATPSGEILGFTRDQVAIDNSGTATDGNIYATSSFDGWIDIFSDEGEFLGRLTGGCDSGGLGGVEGVGVDEDGNVYVSDPIPGKVFKFEPSANPPVNADCVAGLSLNRPGNLAPGAGPTDGHVFVANDSVGETRKLDSALTEIEYVFGKGGSAERRSLTVDPGTGHLFVEAGSSVIEYDASGPSAESVEEVSRLQAAGSVVQGLAVEEGAEKLYVARASTTLVDVWEAVEVPEATVGPPSVVSGAKATVTGSVEPVGLEVTECLFEYGPTTAYGSSVPCQGAIPTDFGTHPVTAQLTGLLAQGATYHYRLLVKSAFGQDASEDETLKTADTFFTNAASDVTETEATLNGTVKPEGVALTECRFEWGRTTEYGQSAPCSPHFSAIPNDDADHAVTGALSGLEPSTVYHYRLRAQNALEQIVAKDRTFATLGTPSVEAQVASALGQSTATLQAQVNPFGSVTTYHFEWGADTSYGNRIPATGELDAGSGDQPVLVDAELSGLEPVSAYHFRVVATNPFGTTVGPDHRFETLNQHGLPDNRGFELVSPVDKGTSGAVSSGFTVQDMTLRAAPDGNSFLWPLENGIPESTAGGWARWRAERTESGWLSTQVSGPSLIAPPKVDELGFADPSVVAHASADLRCGLLRSYNPLTADTLPQSIELGVENLYRWRVEGDSVSYELITDRLPLNPAADPVSGLYNQIEAAEDCSRFYFKSAYELIAGASGLYEWDEGTLRDAGVLPDGTVGDDLPLPTETTAGPAVPGGEVDVSATARWNAVSPDGSRLFFTAIANEGPSSGKPAIFMREDGGASIVEISASETAVATNGARFEAASPDGSRVFFRANYGIAETSSAGASDERCGPLAFPGEVPDETIYTSESNLPIEAKRCDLYAYDVESEELSDLSADANPADPIGAAAQGTVAVDEDGSHVYFAALGQLVPGEGRTYAQNVAGLGSANVYLARLDEDGEPSELTYVTNLGRANGDLLVGALMRTDVLGKWTAEASADGNELLFESTDNLTRYDSGGGKVVYLYSADSGEIACVSCRPDGQPTLVAPDGKFHGGRLDEPKLLNGGARSMSEDGSRVFFVSPDVLMPGAVAGKRNVYEWEEGQVYFLAIAERADGFFLNPSANYLDSSASGDSAFIATDERLAPQDRDFVTDVYAVPVDGGFPVAPELPECQVDESVALLANQIYCQGDRTPAPRTSSPASAGFSGAGNPPPNKPCRKGKLRKRGKCVSKPCPKGKVRKRGKCVNRPKQGAKHKRGRAAHANRGGVK